MKFYETMTILLLTFIITFVFTVSLTEDYISPRTYTACIVGNLTVEQCVNTVVKK